MNRVIWIVIVLVVVVGGGYYIYHRGYPSKSTTSTSTSTSTQAANTITISNMAFSPSSLTVPAGTTVTWINQDSVEHTATSQGLFDSGALGNGQSYTYTFNTVGTYSYSCTIHPAMKGTVTVE